ncbi:MAG: phosphoesterase, partial [Erysipelotrichaceae bacterium]|nr:phosphoesterase [Erysipelotrichaceae bacterium]
MEKNYSFVDLSMAYFEKKSKIYKEGGYKKAISLKKNKEDYENHLFVFLIDLNICLLPVYLWVLEFLLILTGLIPPRIFDLLFYIMY